MLLIALELFLEFSVFVILFHVPWTLCDLTNNAFDFLSLWLSMHFLPQNEIDFYYSLILLCYSVRPMKRSSTAHTPSTSCDLCVWEQGAHSIYVMQSLCMWARRASGCVFLVVLLDIIIILFGCVRTDSTKISRQIKLFVFFLF